VKVKMRKADGESKMIRRLLGDGPTQRARWDILVFWGRYPGGWYSRAAIDPITTVPGHEVGRALEQLVEEGIVDVDSGAYGKYYALTDSPRILSLIKRLGTLSPNARRLVLNRFLSAGRDAREPRTHTRFRGLAGT
jgi:hypothetical protein